MSSSAVTILIFVNLFFDLPTTSTEDRLVPFTSRLFKINLSKAPLEPKFIFAFAISFSVDRESSTSLFVFLTVTFKTNFPFFCLSLRHFKVSIFISNPFKSEVTTSFGGRSLVNVSIKLASATPSIISSGTFISKAFRELCDSLNLPDTLDLPSFKNSLVPLHLNLRGS